MQDSQQDRGDGSKIMRRMADMFQGLKCKEQWLSLPMYHVGKPSKVAAGRTVNWGNHTPGQLSNRNATLTRTALHSDTPFPGIGPEQITRQLLKIYIQITRHTLNTHDYAVGYREDDRLIQWKPRQPLIRMTYTNIHHEVSGAPQERQKRTSYATSII